MFLTVHTAVGALIGQNISSPTGAFLLGWVFHYIFDIIPHGDKNALDIKKIGWMNFLKIAAADHLVAGFFLALIFFLKPGFLFAAPAIAAIIGSVLPDWLQGIYLSAERISAGFGRRVVSLLSPLNRFHLFLHFKIIKREIGFQEGLILQILLVLFFWYLL